jgi:hypothetical protein
VVLTGRFWGEDPILNPLIISIKYFDCNFATKPVIVCLVQPPQDGELRFDRWETEFDLSMPEGLRLLLLSHECALWRRESLGLSDNKQN